MHLGVDEWIQRAFVDAMALACMTSPQSGLLGALRSHKILMRGNGRGEERWRGERVRSKIERDHDVNNKEGTKIRGREKTAFN